MHIRLIFSIVLLAFSLLVQAQQHLRSVFQPANVVHEVPYGANAKTGHYAQASDAKIYYEVYGKGQPIVILHGGGYGSTIEMARFIDSLLPKFQVIAVSTRGHGKSEIGTTPLTYEQKAGDVMAVINAVTKEPVIVLGFSDGAYTGYKVASMYPWPDFPTAHPKIQARRRPQSPHSVLGRSHRNKSSIQIAGLCTNIPYLSMRFRKDQKNA